MKGVARGCFVLFLLLCVGMRWQSGKHSPEEKTVFVSQFVEHPALNRTVQGILDGLRERGFVPGVNLKWRLESAQGNVALASQIAHKFAQRQPDIVVGVGTISAQTLLKYVFSHQLPLIFTSVTDPVGAELVTNLESSTEQLSGISNFVPLEPQIALFRQIQPNLKRLGILYNPGEINSRYIIEQLEELCSRLNITLVKQVVTKMADLAQATLSLSQRVDALFVSNDNTVLGGLQSVVNSCRRMGIPLYVSDTDAVVLGCVAALGPNQYQIGVQTAQMVTRVLEGEELTQLPVELPKDRELHLNLEAARLAGLSIPRELLSAAAQVIGERVEEQ